MWPGTLEAVKAKHGPIQWFCHCKKVSKPVFLALVDHADWTAVTFVWRSWMWQRKHIPAPSLRGIAPRILPVLDVAQPKPLLHMCALKCFWNMTRSEVLQLAGLKHINVPEDQDFVFFCLCKQTEGECLEFILFANYICGSSFRVQNMSNTTTTSTASATTTSEAITKEEPPPTSAASSIANQMQ